MVSKGFAAAVVLALLGGGAALAYRQAGPSPAKSSPSPSPPRLPPLPGQKQLDAALLRARGFDRVAVIQPYELEAKLPPAYECSLNGEFTSCASPDFQVSWRIEPETRSESFALLRQEAERKAQDEAEQAFPGRGGVLGRLDLAGFEGAIAATFVLRRPAVTYTFVGWYEPRAGQRLRLTVTAHSWSADLSPEQTEELLALMGSTRGR